QGQRLSLCMDGAQALECPPVGHSSGRVSGTRGPPSGSAEELRLSEPVPAADWHTILLSIVDRLLPAERTTHAVLRALAQLGAAVRLRQYFLVLFDGAPPLAVEVEQLSLEQPAPRLEPGRLRRLLAHHVPDRVLRLARVAVQQLVLRDHERRLARGRPGARGALVEGGRLPAPTRL